ncbi:EexN family lipoprotein [Phenylobacterium sp.]|uniref:EexN family lipoprotein n=1 Tax=Phenylobacterium sp. TaxID=1871053 RepID=UPI0035698511
MRYTLLLSLLLAACTQPTRSVDWFAAHPEETNRVLVRCERQRLTDADCEAARDAVRRKQDERLKLFRKGA